MTFEQWWNNNEFMQGHFLRLEVKEIGRLAWEAGQQYMLDTQDAPLPRMPPISSRRYKMIPIEEKE